MFVGVNYKPQSAERKSTQIPENKHHFCWLWHYGHLKFGGGRIWWGGWWAIYTDMLIWISPLSCLHNSELYDVTGRINIVFIDKKFVNIMVITRHINYNFHPNLHPPIQVNELEWWYFHSVINSDRYLELLLLANDSSNWAELYVN